MASGKSRRSAAKRAATPQSKASTATRPAPRPSPDQGQTSPAAGAPSAATTATKAAPRPSGTAIRSAALTGARRRSRMNRYAIQRRRRTRIIWGAIALLAVASLAYVFWPRGSTTKPVVCATNVHSGMTGTPTAAGGPPAVSGKLVTVGNTCLKYIDTKVGTGPAVKNGDTVTVNYTGWLANGTKFDSSVDASFKHVATFAVSVGQGQVIPGWDKGLIGMKAGGERRLIIPPDLGYGAHGSTDGTIPPNAVLVFDITVVKIG